MLKEFWDQKKHLIQFLGIVIGIGAIFLGIPLPENEVAALALKHVQLGWLVIITIGSIFLFIQFLILSFQFEKKISIENTFSYLVYGFIFFILTNLWSYIFNLYKDALIELLSSMWFSIAFMSFCIVGIFDFLVLNKKLNGYLSILITYLLTVPLFGLWTQVKLLDFSIIDFLNSLAVGYAFGSVIVAGFAIIMFLFYFRKNGWRAKDEIFYMKNSKDNFHGILIEESLEDRNVLKGLFITKTYTENVDNAMEGQSHVWTMNDFVIPNGNEKRFSEDLSKSLKPGKWYVDFKNEKEIWVVFAGKIFHYVRGDETGKQQVIEYARTLDIPESQLDWEK